VNPARWAVLLLLVALAARIGAVWAIGSGFHFADEAIYVDTARRLSDGAGFGIHFQQAPAYPVFLLLLSWLPGEVTSLRVGQALIVAFGTLLVFLLGDRMFGRRTAIAAALVYALDPLLVFAAGLLYPEAIAALLLPIAVLAAVQGAENDDLRRSALSGALLGVLALLRPVALILPPVMAAWMALPGETHPARRYAHVLALGLAFLLLLAPWTARNYRIHGQLVPVAAAGTHTALASRKQITERGLPVAMAEWAWDHPARFVSRLTRQFILFWELRPTRLSTDDPLQRQRLHQTDPRLSVQPLVSHRLRDLVSTVSFGSELLLALFGLVVVARTRRRETLLLVALIVAYAIGYALFVAKVRYRIPILPLLFLFTGAGAASAFQRIRRATGAEL
jgi:4-amino-4-deoxy-L-arabinose transferase-like glycosyltransferase